MSLIRTMYKIMKTSSLLFPFCFYTYPVLYIMEAFKVGRHVSVLLNLKIFYEGFFLFCFKCLFFYLVLYVLRRGQIWASTFQSIVCASLRYKERNNCNLVVFTNHNRTCFICLHLGCSCTRFGCSSSRLHCTIYRTSNGRRLSSSCRPYGTCWPVRLCSYLSYSRRTRIYFAPEWISSLVRFIIKNSPFTIF